ncbi:hypothetical protein F5I97DRAFT_1903058 [Phlebopus sp. FC_14]|nr:hypothetical protein F5I97DRAFT_1903058 [Phlebopus sp. FC_14]
MAPRNQKSRKETSKRIILRIPAPATASGSSTKSKITEASLRKLPRAELQKLARENGIRANMKSEMIIRDLLKVGPENKGLRTEEDTSEASPAKKKAKMAEDPTPRLPPTPESQTVALTDDATKHLYEALSGALQQPATESQEDYPMEDDNLYSASDSGGSHVTQPDYATPVSSRSGTPLPSSISQLERSVRIMQEISEQDQAMIAQIAQLREKAAQLRKQTQDIRDVVRAEQGRRERMEAFFTYWTEIEEGWHRKWLWGEAMIPPKYLILQGGYDV